MKNRILLHSRLPSLALLALASYACGTKDTGVLDGLPATGGSTSSGGSLGAVPATGGTGGSGTGGTGATGGGGSAGTFAIDPTQNGSAGTAMQVDEEALCGVGEASAELKDVTMFIMYDRSWSMTQCADPALTPGGQNPESLACTDGMSPSRWDLTSRALTQFFQASDAAGLRVALRFFPDDVPGCTGYQSSGRGGRDEDAPMPNCDVATCARPQVDSGLLTAEAAPSDAHEAALIAAVAAATPPGPAMPDPNPATPTFAALSGAAQWATQHQATSPDEQTVIVLVTDGEPYGCDTNPDNIAGIARDAYLDSGILTYVIGLTGASEPQLNQLAAAGGTDQAYFVADGSTATEDLLQALLAIRGMPITCDFAVPEATSTGEPIDPHLVNVNYTSSSGTETELGLVTDAAACGTEQAWYYDDPATPTRILLCPAACATVTEDTQAQIKILAGCKPRVADPR